MHSHQTISFRSVIKGKFNLLFVAGLLFSSSIFISCETEMPDNDTANQTEQTAASETPAAAAEAPAADEGKGVGPVKNVEVGASVDQSMAEKGKTIFEAKCTACHNTDATKKVGPGLAKVTERRKPEWIMNMILNPEKMVQEDPTAKELLAEYLAPMANQSLTEEEARHILEYFRQNDSK